MRLITDILSIDSDTVVTATSSNPNFPVSNLKHSFRSKVWRSTGTFVIDATNNKIDFKESGGGSELTATLGSGSYSTTGLASEIKTQLESAGANTYTVTYSSQTGLWTIASDGATFQLLCSSGTNALTNTLVNCLGFTNTDKTGALTYTGAAIAIHTKEAVTFDLLTSEPVNSIALLWPKEDGIKLSGTAVVKVEANATNTWSSPAVSQTLSIDNDYSIASHYFSTDQSYRYWRVTIQDAQNANLYVELGVVVIGKALELDEPENGFKFVIRDDSKITTTDYGNVYVDEYPQTKSLTISYKYMDTGMVDLIEEAYRTNGVRTPVYITLDQTEDIFDKDQYAIYGRFAGNYAPDHVRYTYFDIDLAVVEIA